MPGDARARAVCDRVEAAGGAQPHDPRIQAVGHQAVNDQAFCMTLESNRLGRAASPLTPFSSRVVATTHLWRGTMRDPWACSRTYSVAST